MARIPLHCIPILLCAGLPALAADPARANGDDVQARLSQGGHVLMIRHAHAPGFGDPPGFRLGDCGSQRNLDQTGRAQAAAIGAWLRARGLGSAPVYSSQWCRCLETARLLRLGPVTPLAALNSFFERPQDRESTTRPLRAFLARQPPDGPLLVLVTHQVNIQAVADTGLNSGEGILLERLPGGITRVVGRLDFDGALTRRR
jgi:broad specificity phosphatase PhoE